MLANAGYGDWFSQSFAACHEFSDLRVRLGKGRFPLEVLTDVLNMPADAVKETLEVGGEGPGCRSAYPGQCGRPRGCARLGRWRSRASGRSGGCARLGRWRSRASGRSGGCARLGRWRRWALVAQVLETSGPGGLVLGSGFVGSEEDR